MPYTNSKTGKIETTASDNCSIEWAVRCLKENLASLSKWMSKIEDLLTSGTEADVKTARGLVKMNNYFREELSFLDRIAYLAAHPEAPVIHYEQRKTEKSEPVQ